MSSRRKMVVGERLFRCLECGGDVILQTGEGRRIPYRNLPDLEVPASIAIPTCSGCGEQYVSDSVAKGIEEAMEPLYQQALNEMVRSAIDALSTVATQGEIERKLGMAQGYLSKLKSGTRKPSPEIALHLAMLARNPRKSLREIDDLWAAAAKRATLMRPAGKR